MKLNTPEYQPQQINLKPDYHVQFHNGEGVVGRLDFNGPGMTFEGEADESAKIFMNYLADSFKGRFELDDATIRKVFSGHGYVVTPHAFETARALLAAARGVGR